VVQVSYADLYGVGHEPEFEETIQAGDMVRTGPNLFPHFTVVAVDGDKAWLRNIQNGMDALANVKRCSKINGPVSAPTY
jgi:hypothetical protein